MRHAIPCATIVVVSRNCCTRYTNFHLVIKSNTGLWEVVEGEEETGGPIHGVRVIKSYATL